MKMLLITTFLKIGFISLMKHTQRAPYCFSGQALQIFTCYSINYQLLANLVDKSSEWLLPLHSSVFSADEKKVFLRPPVNMLKEFYWLLDKLATFECTSFQKRTSSLRVLNLVSYCIMIFCSR